MSRQFHGQAWLFLDTSFKIENFLPLLAEIITIWLLCRKVSTSSIKRQNIPHVSSIRTVMTKTRCCKTAGIKEGKRNF